MKKLFRKVLSSVLCLAMFFSFLQFSAFNAFGLSINIGKNPTPKVDIAVSVPADFNGTFEEFKEQLTQALIAAGMNAEDFRITDTAVKIDTTNLDGWYVYDHYYDRAAYNALGLSAEQQKKQPFRQADNSQMSVQGGCPTPVPIQDVFVNRKYGAPGKKLWPFNQHTYSWSENERANMCFAGYGTNVKADFMIYPATSDSRRTIEFDLDCAVVDTHTLDGAGFLLNSAVDNNILNGYALYYQWTSATAANAQLRQITNYNTMANAATAASNETLPGTVMNDQSKSVSLPSGTKLRIRVVLERDKVTVTQRTYTGNTMGPEVVLFDKVSLPVQAKNGNGFGPIVGYKSHGCQSMTYFQYGDLAMTYDATAFDALKEVQYVQSAEQKYFINLSGQEGPGIPDQVKEAQGYVDGINRMEQNEIFYISDVDDGQVLKDTETKDDGSKTIGLGAENGSICPNVDAMARYIAENFTNKKEFVHQNPIESDRPLADFYITNNTPGEAQGSQLLTVHQKHLSDSDVLKVNIKDKSKLGTPALGAGTSITKYELTVYDPDNNAVDGFNKITVNSVNDIPDFNVTNKTASGRYTYELRVMDDQNNWSETSRTYFTVFMDDKMPEVSAENTAKNIATITLTDTGQGIDDDGITFIEDNRGSGVYAYYLTDDASKELEDVSEEDWIYLDEPIHSHSFDVNISEYVGANRNLVIIYKDECGNGGNKAVFKPVHVVVKDNEDNEIDDYYVIGREPIIVLPDEVPEIDDPDFEFSHWGVEDPDNPDNDNPITSGETIGKPTDDDDNPEIVIKPTYTDKRVNLTYNANAADAVLDEDGNATATYQITEKSDLAKKIAGHNITPTRAGYDFTGWTLDAAGTQPVTNQTADADITVYAQWKIASYTLTFDHNGGGSTGVRSKVLQYGENVPNYITNNIKPNENPMREGYIFSGWALDKEGTQPIPANFTMPANDYTVYAKWIVNTEEYLVHFNSNGGNTIGDQAYKVTNKVYSVLQTPIRAGYDFDGWYEQLLDDNNNPVVGDTKVESKGGILAHYLANSDLQQRSHTLIAKWTPSANTKYTVAYYLNSGAKNEDGEYVYVKLNNLTKTYYGVTESTVTVPEEDLIAELTTDNYAITRDYWYNAELHPEERTGTVVGGTPLELKVYYDRFFNVNGIVASGEGTGTVSSALRVKEGSRPTVTWQPAEGYHTTRVILDNRIRDGLVSQNSFTLEEDIHKDYNFRVYFSNDPNEGPVIGPEAERYHTVYTKIEGCYDGTCIISPTARYVDGRDEVYVRWQIPENYVITDIIIDNEALIVENYKDEPWARFRYLNQDHNVLIKVKKLPTVGGGSTEGQYTVTVNTYGGDSKVAVDPTKVLNAGENHTVKWNATASDYKVSVVYVDGVKFEPSGIKKDLNDNFCKFQRIDANHVVDIYLTAKDDPSTDIPVYEDEDYSKLSTQIVGGPGTITGGGLIDKEAEQTVSWTINAPDVKPDSEDYTYYEVESVIVNGEEKEIGDASLDSLNLGKLTEDTNVVVNIKPVLYNVNILKYGNGTTSETKTFYKGQSYKNIFGTPDADHSIVKIVVDGTIEFDAFAPATNTFRALRRAAARMVDSSDLVNVTNKDANSMGVDITGLDSDHTIEVYFTPNAEDGSATPVPANTYTVSVTTNVPASVVTGQGIVDENTDKTVTWTVPDGYKIKTVTVNGTVTEVTDNKIDFTAINENKKVVVTFEKDAPNSTDIPVKPDNHDDAFTITGKIVGGKGEMSGTGVFDAGHKAEISWTALPLGDEMFEVKYVIVDGKIVPDLEKDNHIIFTDDKDHDVVVVIEVEEKLPTDVDVDGDGKPDINIDDNGDGEPDINVDTDGDGEPDINIDENGDGEPDKEIDEDGDLKVDTYVTVRHTDAAGNKLADYVVIRGNRGDNYTTSEVTLRDYDLVATPENASGVMQDVDTYVNYVYTPKAATVKVEFLKEDGTALADSVTLNGHVFDNYSADAAAELQKLLDSGKTYGYKLVSKTNDEGTMTVDQQVVTYTFARRDSVVTVKFVDQDGNEIPGVEKVTIEGKALNEYKTEPDNDIYGYALDTTKLPANAEGTFAEEEIVVTYVYNLKDSKVVVNYVDEDGNKLDDQIVMNSKVFAEYKTEAKSFYGYKLIAEPANAKGTYEEEDTVVTYSYKLKDTSVIVNHINKNGDTVAPSVTLNGKVFDDFATKHLENIYGYKFVDVVVEDPEAAMIMLLAAEETETELKDYDGQMKESVIVVNYIYDTKDAEVIVKYVDENGNELSDTETINGRVFDKYDTNAKDIYAYELVSASENADGEMTENTITVVYTYKQVLNIDTDKDGEPDINIDTDKDGKPDVNIDTDKDGEPDINIDTDKDGEPDVNIDTDKDGKPDINIDTDKDGKPDVNIDTDKDGEPDINIDTDKDGKPDVNIDTDKDGKPDINIDTDKDGKPDVNVDTDKDGKPDINIDTDGDGKPNINIDTTGDGVPNINIDLDGDGKADINIDTTGDGKADVNVDTDGDGKADINIDTTGDGKADSNLDTDGDGIADTNIIGAVDTGSNDMFRLAFYSVIALFAGLFLAVFARKNRKESEAK